jgi:hypothetical protein
MSYKPFNPFVPPPQPQKPKRGPEFFDKQGKPIDPKKAERRKITRFLLNPEIGAGIQDMKATHGLFLRLVCNIFLQVGLIDAAYPGIADERKLGLRSLITYAFRNLEYTREGMPRVLMFYSFLASIAAMGFAFVIFMLHVMGSSGGHPAAHVAAPPVVK